MDYTTIHETATFKMKDLGFTVYWWQNQRLNHWFVDYWSKAKKDFKFTAEALFQLLSFEWFRNFDSIIIWSDGGLKSKEILFYLSNIAESI